MDISSLGSDDISSTKEGGCLSVSFVRFGKDFCARLKTLLHMLQKVVKGGARGVYDSSVRPHTRCWFAIIHDDII